MGKRIKHYIIDEIAHKRCSKCNEWLTLDNFYKNKRRWDGLCHRCKKCKAKKDKKYQKKYQRTEKFKKYQKKYQRTKKYKDSVRKYRSKPGIKNKYNIRHRTKQSLGSAKNYPCMMCNKQAEEFHHFTYDEHFKVNTVTLCKDCHNLIHKKS